MKYLLAIVLLFSFGQAMAAGSYVTGSVLLEQCDAHINETNIADGNVCVGYIAGIADVHITFVDWGDMEKNMCIPFAVGSTQLVRIVTKYLQEHPENLHLAASSLVLTALGTAFPCE